MPLDISHLSCSSSPSPSVILAEAPSMARECRQRPAPATAPQTRDQPPRAAPAAPAFHPGHATLPGARPRPLADPRMQQVHPPVTAPLQPSSLHCGLTRTSTAPTLTCAHRQALPTFHPPREGRARGPALAQAARQGSSFPDTVSFSSSKSGFLTNIHTCCDFTHFSGSEPHTPRYSHHPIPLHRVTMSSSGDDSPPTILSIVLSRTHRSTP